MASKDSQEIQWKTIDVNIRKDIYRSNRLWRCNVLRAKRSYPTNGDRDSLSQDDSELYRQNRLNRMNIISSRRSSSNTQLSHGIFPVHLLYSLLYKP